MPTITVRDVYVNSKVINVTFTQLSEDTYELTSDKQPTLRIKPYSGVFPLLEQKYCVTHANGIILGKTPAEAFEKAVQKYWC